MNMISPLQKNPGRTYPLAPVIILVALAMILASCKDQNAGGQIGVVFPDSNVSYGKHVQPLFDQGCAFSGCHGPETFAEHGYALDSYGNARARSGIIVPFNPEGSILIQSVEGRAANVRRMPLGSDELTQNQINGLKKWISEGARNN